MCSSNRSGAGDTVTKTRTERQSSQVEECEGNTTMCVRNICARCELGSFDGCYFSDITPSECHLLELPLHATVWTVVQLLCYRIKPVISSG